MQARAPLLHILFLGGEAALTLQPAVPCCIAARARRMTRLPNGVTLRAEREIELTDPFLAENQDVLGDVVLEEVSVVEVHVPNDNADQHLAVVVAGTLWWCLCSSAQMLHFNPPTDFFGLSDAVVQGLGVFVFVSQLLVYGGCHKLARAETLREAQTLANMMTALCVPAGVIITLVNPTGAKGITILAFAQITMFFGIHLAHYLRKAGFREVPPDEHRVSLKTSDNIGGWSDSLKNCRPPAHVQATHLAVAFARSFVAFTIAAGFVGQYVVQDDIHNPIVLGSLIAVVLHTALDCTLTTVFPGAGLEQYTSFLVFEALLYSIHMFAASMGSFQSVFGDSLIDQALFIWLFGSAVAKVMDRLSRLLGRVDFDEKLGLSDLDR